ncbi:SRPBCC family protein [Rhodococcus sp. X156]|uniref:SRPBCC family protein n=1 Tax=Rhodococcus sp. X156 TaxID=2499145 RepID=UPI000FD9F606|nr:SRPBCC family protein [Rhodococcus sp. X156]
MSTRTALQLHQDVAAPAQKVWDALVDWPSQHEWMLGTRVRVSAGDGRGVGSQLVAFSGAGPLGFLDTMVITEWDPPRRCVVDHTGRVVRGAGVFAVVPRSAHECTVVWREELDLPLGVLGALGWPLVRAPFAAGVRLSLRRLARRCEGPGEAGPG